jgi:hypothetical protein
VGLTTDDEVVPAFLRELARSEGDLVDSHPNETGPSGYEERSAAQTAELGLPRDPAPPGSPQLRDPPVLVDLEEPPSNSPIAERLKQKRERVLKFWADNRVAAEASRMGMLPGVHSMPGGADHAAAEASGTGTLLGGPSMPGAANHAAAEASGVETLPRGPSMPGAPFGVHAAAAHSIFHNPCGLGGGNLYRPSASDGAELSCPNEGWYGSLEDTNCRAPHPSSDAGPCGHPGVTHARPEGQNHSGEHWSYSAGEQNHNQSLWSPGHGQAAEWGTDLGAPEAVPPDVGRGFGGTVPWAQEPVPGYQNGGHHGDPAAWGMPAEHPDAHVVWFAHPADEGLPPALLSNPSGSEVIDLSGPVDTEMASPPASPRAVAVGLFGMREVSPGRAPLPNVQVLQRRSDDIINKCLLEGSPEAGGLKQGPAASEPSQGAGGGEAGTLAQSPAGPDSLGSPGGIPRSLRVSSERKRSLQGSPDTPKAGQGHWQVQQPQPSGGDVAAGQADNYFPSHRDHGGASSDIEFCAETGAYNAPQDPRDSATSPNSRGQLGRGSTSAKRRRRAGLVRVTEEFGENVIPALPVEERGRAPGSGSVGCWDLAPWDEQGGRTCGATNMWRMAHGAEPLVLRPPQPPPVKNRLGIEKLQSNLKDHVRRGQTRAVPAVQALTLELLDEGGAPFSWV